MEMFRITEVPEYRDQVNTSAVPEASFILRYSSRWLGKDQKPICQQPMLSPQGFGRDIGRKMGRLEVFADSAMTVILVCLVVAPE